MPLDATQRDVYTVPLQLRRGVHRTRAGESELKAVFSHIRLLDDRFLDL